MNCEFPESNASTDEVNDVVHTMKRVAVVGMSPKEERDSHMVGKCLMDQGVTVIPVNPVCDEILGLPCYPDVLSVPGHVDVVDIFRKPEAIPTIVEQAIEKGAACVWMQLGLAHNEAADKARAAGLRVVMNMCLKVEHARLIRESGA